MLPSLAPNTSALVSLLVLAPPDARLGRTLPAFNVTITAGAITLQVPFTVFIGEVGVNASLSVLTVDQCVSISGLSVLLP
jgi:hypothetical protein